MRLKRILASAAEISPVRAYQLLRQPWRVSMALTGSPAQSDDEALGCLFPDLRQETLHVMRGDFNSNHAFFLEINRKMVDVRRRRHPTDPFEELLYLSDRIVLPLNPLEGGAF